LAAKIEEKILSLKEKHRAVILAHNYQIPEVQDIADFVGDSLELSRKAAQTDAEVIVFCGVHFMAETAKIISPSRTVLIPEPRAGCPLADTVTAAALLEKKKELGDPLVISYVNTTAEVKAVSDICCTSGNAVQVVRGVPQDREILFVPDSCLGDWVSKQVGRKMHLWRGGCPTHHRILPSHIEEARRLHPGAKVVVHPECLPDVVKMADAVASTSGILRIARESSAQEFIIGTENGILHRLARENPQKRFWSASKSAICPNMKLITLEKLHHCLETMSGEVTVPPEIRERARAAIEKMLAVNT